MRLDGKFTLSDDSHCIAHVGTNYKLAMEFLETLGLKEVYVLDRQDEGSVSTPGSKLVPIPVHISEIKASLQGAIAM